MQLACVGHSARVVQYDGGDCRKGQWKSRCWEMLMQYNSLRLLLGLCRRPSDVLVKANCI